MASVEENVATSRKFNELVGQDKSLKWVDEFVTPDFKFHDVTAPNLPTGPEGGRKFLKTYVTAFPDLKLTVVDAFGVGDKVATRWVAEGTHTGPLMGSPPTGNKFSNEGMTIDRFDESGKIAESWNTFDSHHLLMQLGLAGEAPQRKAEAEQRPGVQ